VNWSSPTKVSRGAFFEQIEQLHEMTWLRSGVSYRLVKPGPKARVADAKGLSSGLRRLASRSLFLLLDT
jgi:hypothetical protein